MYQSTNVSKTKIQKIKILKQNEKQSTKNHKQCKTNYQKKSIQSLSKHKKLTKPIQNQNTKKSTEKNS